MRHGPGLAAVRGGSRPSSAEQRQLGLALAADDREVDLVFDHPDQPLAFEIGSSPDHPRTGITALHEKHPRFRGRCYVVAPQASVTQPDATPTGIGTLPLDLFLQVVGAQAEAALAASLGAL